MPHPLPGAGPPYTTALRYLLVAIPDDPAFGRAANAVYSDLSYYWKWGLEGNEDGREEAGAAWAAAVHETYRLLDMGFPDVLLGYIDTVETKLQALIDKDSCCSDPTQEIETPGGGTGTGAGDENDVPTSDYDAGTNPAPDYATDSTGATAFEISEYETYLCQVAHWFFDFLLDWLGYIKFVRILGLSAGRLVEWLVKKIAGSLFPIGVDFALDTFPSISSLLLNWGVEITSTVIDNTIAEIEALEDEIICAIADSDTAEEAETAIRGIISAEVSDASIIALLLSGPLPALFSLMWNAVIDPSAYESATCDCEMATDSVTFTFDADADGWTKGATSVPAEQSTPADHLPAFGNPAGSTFTPNGTDYVISPAINFVPFETAQLSVNVSRGADGAQRCAHAYVLNESGNALWFVSSFFCSTTAAFNNIQATITLSYAGGPLWIAFQGQQSGTLVIDNVTLTKLT